MTEKSKQKSIPNGWRKMKFGDIVSVKSGIGFKAKEYVRDGVRLLQIENVGYGKIKWSNCVYLPSSYLSEYPELHLKEGDIVLALNRPITNNMLKIAMLTKSDSASILYQRVGKFLLKNEEIDKRYLYQISKVFIKSFVLSHSIGSDQPFISLKSLYEFKLFLPPLPEQKRIVAVLETWDKYLEALERKKKIVEAQKKYLLNNLITGKIRTGRMQYDKGVCNTPVQG